MKQKYDEFQTQKNIPIKSYILIVIVSFFVLTNLFWIFFDTRPPSWDEAHYLEASEVIYKNCVNLNLTTCFDKATTVLPRRTPLISYLPFPFYFIFGNSYDSALLVNIISLLGFYFFFYKLLKKLKFKFEFILVSLLIINTMPIFYSLNRLYFVEFGLLTLVTIFIYLIQEIDLNKPRKILILGSIFSLGILMKINFIIYIIGPSLIELLKIAKKHNKKKLFVSLTYFILPVIILTLPWFSKNILTVLWHAKRATNPEILGSQYYYGPPFSQGNIYGSILDISNYTISSYYFVLLIVLILFIVLKKIKIKIDLTLASWFLIPFLFFFFGPNKDYRFYLPLIPPVAIFITTMIYNLKLFKFISLILFLPIIIYISFLTPQQHINIPEIRFGPLTFIEDGLGNYVSQPKKEDWQLKQLVLTMNKLVKDDQNKKVLNLTEIKELNINNLKYEAYKQNTNIEFKTISYYPKNYDKEKIKTEIFDYSFIIYKYKNDGLNRYGFSIKEISQKLLTPINTEIIFPDNDKLLIYKINKHGS